MPRSCPARRVRLPPFTAAPCASQYGGGDPNSMVVYGAGMGGGMGMQQQGYGYGY